MRVRGPVGRLDHLPAEEWGAEGRSWGSGKSRNLTVPRRETERQTKTQTERQRGTETDREIERDRGRKTERWRQRQGQERDRNRETERPPMTFQGP